MLNLTALLGELLKWFYWFLRSYWPVVGVIVGFLLFGVILHVVRENIGGK